MNKERCYSLDGEWFEDYEAIMQRLLRKYREGDSVIVFQGDTFIENNKSIKCVPGSSVKNIRKIKFLVIRDY